MDQQHKYLFDGNIMDEKLLNVLSDVPASTFDLIIFNPKVKDFPVKESIYSSWLFDLSQKMMRSLKSTGSMIVILKEGVEKGKRKTFALEYTMKMSDYWTETYIWQKSNPHPTGNKKRLKDGFEYIFQFNRSNDYNFFPDNCLVKAKSQWTMGDSSSRLSRPSNVLSFPNGGDIPIGLCEFFINLMTEEGDLVFCPTLESGNEITACMNLNREYFGLCKDDGVLSTIEEKILDWKERNLCVTETIFG